MILPYAATARKFVNELSMVNNSIIKSLRQIVLAHQIVRYKGNVDNVTTAIMRLNTPKAYSDSIERCRQSYSRCSSRTQTQAWVQHAITAALPLLGGAVPGNSTSRFAWLHRNLDTRG